MMSSRCSLFFKIGVGGGGGVEGWFKIKQGFKISNHCGDAWFIHLETNQDRMMQMYDGTLGMIGWDNCQPSVWRHAII